MPHPNLPEVGQASLLAAWHLVRHESQEYVYQRLQTRFPHLGQDEYDHAYRNALGMIATAGLFDTADGLTTISGIGPPVLGSGESGQLHSVIEWVDDNGNVGYRDIITVVYPTDTIADVRHRIDTQIDTQYPPDESVPGGSSNRWVINAVSTVTVFLA